jgi:hypothetical protein
MEEKKDNELIPGFQILRLHYSADPEKDEKWVEKTKATTESETWEREYELKPVGHDGNYPVFGDYKKARHESKLLQFDPQVKQIIRGWDFGKVHPCVEFIQIKGLEKNVIGECYGTNIYLSDFIQEVFTYSQINFPGATFIDWVDATGKNERDNGLPSVKIMHQYGLTPKWRMQDIEEGVTKIQKELVMSTSSGRPYLMFNPDKCPHICAAMRGGYQRDKHGKPIKDGTHDHPADAFRYGFTGYVTTHARTDSDFYRKLKEYKYKPHNPHTGY